MRIATTINLRIRQGIIIQVPKTGHPREDPV